MTTPDITVVVPTVSGREAHLARCIASYREHTAATIEVLTYLNRPGVAYGWQLGAEASRGEYLHLTCDDIMPMPGWDAAAIACVEAGNQPAPRLFNADGTPWDGAPPEYDPLVVPAGAPVPLGSLPFMARENWQHVTPLPPGLHYFTDNWVTWRLDEAGVGTVMCYGYDFIHTWATEHRGAGYKPNDRGPADAEYVKLAGEIVARGREGLR